jgi:endonuclease-3
VNKNERYKGVLDWFSENVPVAETELHFGSPFQLLVAVILSAQCTDKRVNIVSKRLFEIFPDSQRMSKATQAEVFELIKSISYPNNKSKHILESAKMIQERFSGEVPSSLEELQMLPGVGRKTANVIASVLYNEPVIAVDTHVFRVARRIGLSNSKNVRGVEDDLTANIPGELRAIAHHWLILHGRYICTARKPKCDECGLKAFCKFYSSHIPGGTDFNK